MKYYYTILTVLLCIGAIAADTGEVTIEQAVELSDKQRVLAQRAAKVYIGLCNNLKDIKLYQDRDDIIKEFEENLYEMGKCTPTDPIRVALKDLRVSWTEYVGIVGWSIRKEDGAKLLKQLDHILATTKIVHQAYLAQAQAMSSIKPTEMMVATNELRKKNTNQHILIERILLYYLAEKSGIAGTESGHRLDEAQMAFSGLLQELSDSKPTNIQIQQKYNVIRESWVGITPHLVFTSKRQKTHLDDMYLRAEKISETIIEVSDLYEELGQALSVSNWMLQMSNQSFEVQKITKKYIALIAVDEPTQYVYKQDIIAEINGFEEELRLFEKTAPDLATQQELVTIWNTWNIYKKSIDNLSNVQEENFPTIIEQAQQVVDACEGITERIKAFALQLPSIQQLRADHAEEINSQQSIVHHLETIHDLRLISQRVARSFILQVHAPNGANQALLDTDITAYQQKYTSLLSSIHNSVSKQKILESCQTEWDWMETASATTNEKQIPQFLEHADLLGRKLSKLNKLYSFQMEKILTDITEEELPAALPSPVAEQPAQD